jgi:hypothetical protein
VRFTCYIYTVSCEYGGLAPARDLGARRPDATPVGDQLFVSRLNVGPSTLRYVDATIGCLRGAGFSYPMADYAWTALAA